MPQTVEASTRADGSDDRMRMFESLKLRRDALLRDLEALEREMGQVANSLSVSLEPRPPIDPAIARYFTQEFTEELLAHFAGAKAAALK